MLLKELKAALDVSSSESDDELMVAGKAVTRLMESYTQRPLERQVVIENFYSPVEFPLFLRGFPIISLSSVRLNNGIDDKNSYKLNFRTGRLWLPGIGGYTTSEDELEVIYEAGFDPVPEDLLHVFVEAVKITRMQQDRTSAAALPTVTSSAPIVKSVSIPDAISIQYEQTGISNSAALSAGSSWADTPIGPFVGILDSYRSARSYGSFG
jgi:hypothetical protein